MTDRPQQQPGSQRGSQQSRPIQPPPRAPSSSTSLSGHSNPYTTRTPSRHESENNTLSQSLSPSSLNPQLSAEGGYDENDPRFRRPSLQPQNITGQPLSTEPQGLGYGAGLIGFGVPPGGQYTVNEWPNNPLPVGYGIYYEPQGELEAQLQSQQIPANDFTNPFSARRASTASAPEGLGGPLPFQIAPAQNLNMLSAAQAAIPHDMTSRTTTNSSITTRSGQKRKAESRSDESVATTQPSTAQASTEPAPKRPSLSKAPDVPTTQATTPRTTRSQPPAAPASETGRSEDEPESEAPDPKPKPAASKQKQSESSVERRIAEVSSRLTTVLPAGKVFPIQIGSELFRLSGASISSDAPSYFSHYFGEQLIQTGGRASQVKTLYIDRDPETFKDIALHLQGYYVKPHNEEHFVRLFADAQFYSLPRLTQQLFKSEIFIQVGDRHFQIPRDIFSSPGDSPNFFSLGFAHFFSTPSEVFPGLDRQTLLRPPSILPPAIANRSGDVFADLLRILQGYEVHIRDADHRAELLRDAKYFHLKGVEQKLLPCSISHNILRGRTEIALRLEDVRQSGVNFLPEAGSRGMTQRDSTTSTSKPATPHSADDNVNIPTGWVTYQRPYVDDTAHDLILEISAKETTRLDLAAMRASFSGQSKARISSLFSVIANKLNLPAMMPLGLMMIQSGGGIAAQAASPANSGVSGDRVRIRVERDCFIVLDGSPVEWDDDAEDEEMGTETDMSEVISALPRVRKWKEGKQLNKEMEWLIRKGQWRLHVEAAEEGEAFGSPGKVEVVLDAVRLEGYTREVHRNEQRGFLS